MRAAGLPILFLLALGLTACKSDPKADGPRLALAEQTDGTTTGSIPRVASFFLDPGVAGWYRERGATLPLTDRPIYCHGFGCEFQTVVPMGESEYAELAAVFARFDKTPEGERRAVDLADQWWEKHAQPLLGGPPDKRGSEFGDAHKLGQTDCLDEATNTTTLLVWLERRGLLKFHHVVRPESRGAFLYAHATAVMRDTTTGVDWIADSWMRDGGDPIDVMTLDEWFSRAYVDPTS